MSQETQHPPYDHEALRSSEKGDCKAMDRAIGFDTEAVVERANHLFDDLEIESSGKTGLINSEAIERYETNFTKRELAYLLNLVHQQNHHEPSLGDLLTAMATRSSGPSEKVEE